MVSLEIPYYPCLFGQTKSVPGIKYRILRDGENNYYDSFKSVYCQGLKWFALFSWLRNHDAVQEGVQSSAGAYEQLQIAEFVKIWQMMFVTLAWQRSLIRAD